MLRKLELYKEEIEKLKDKVKILEEEKERERQEKERYLALLKKYGIKPE
ncbi:MAG: hypothetical protein ACTSU2_16165 [Promethearchaeota archaeon]